MSDSLRFTFTQPPPGPDGGGRWSVGANRWAAATRPLVRNALKAKAPIGQGDGRTGRKPGQFKASITQHTTSRTRSMLLEFGSPQPYTPYIIGGTRPHMIVPRNARVLRFRAGGADVFAARVNHPGTRPNDFSHRALVPLLPEIQQSFSLVMHEAFGGV